MQLPRSVQAGAEIIRFALAAELGENGRIVLFLPVSLAISVVQWYADNSIVGLSTAACFWDAVPAENIGRRLHHEEIAGFADGSRRDVPAGDTGFRGHRGNGGGHCPDRGRRGDGGPHRSACGGNDCAHGGNDRAYRGNLCAHGSHRGD